MGVGDVATDRDAARVGVLDDRDRRLGEVVRRPIRRLSVDVVVVAHLLAVQLLGLREPRLGRRVDVERGRAGGSSRRTAARCCRRQRLPGERPATTASGSAVTSCGEPLGHRDVVRRRVRERRGREPLPLRQREPHRPTPPPARSSYWSGEVTIATLGWFFAAARTIDGPPMSICSMHSSASRTGCGRLGERVEVGHHEVERLDAELRELRAVRLEPQVGQDAGVHPRVQRLDPSVEALGEPGQVLDLRHVDTGVRDPRGRRAGRHDRDPGGGQRRRRAPRAGSCRRPRSGPVRIGRLSSALMGS